MKKILLIAMWPYRATQRLLTVSGARLVYAHKPFSGIKRADLQGDTTVCA